MAYDSDSAMPWCGYLIDTQNLSVSSDYTRYQTRKWSGPGKTYSLSQASSRFENQALPTQPGRWNMDKAKGYAI